MKIILINKTIKIKKYLIIIKRKKNKIMNYKMINRLIKVKKYRRMINKKFQINKKILLKNNR